MLQRSGGRGHFLAQPDGNRQGIETDATADLETGDPMFRREFVDLALRDVQQFGDICDGEGAAFPV